MPNHLPKCPAIVGSLSGPTTNSSNINIKKSSQKPISNINYYLFSSLAEVLLVTVLLDEPSSLEDFLKLLIAEPKSAPTFLSFLVPNKTTTMININNIDQGDIPLNMLIPHFFLNLFSSMPDSPNLLSSSFRISLDDMSFKDKDTNV